MDTQELKRLEQYQHESGLLLDDDRYGCYCGWSGYKPEMETIPIYKLPKVTRTLQVIGKSFHCPECTSWLTEERQP